MAPLPSRIDCNIPSLYISRVPDHYKLVPCVLLPAPISNSAFGSPSTTGIEFEESKKDKKPKEVKADLTVLEVCQKMNVTIHELREMVNSGEFPKPDCDKKWSVKLLKKEGII